MKKKIILSIIISLLCIALVTVCILGEIYYYKSPDDIDTDEITLSAKNVVMMIGDGMGPTHIEVTKKHFDLKSLYMESMSTTSGYATTRSLDNFITDSAASATALSTGFKTNNGSVSYYNGKNLQNMAEYAKSLGMSVGIIATETLKGATPAGFSSHSSSRDNSQEITLNQINSQVDLFIGSGTDYYAEYTTQFATNNITYCTSIDQLEEHASHVSSPEDKKRIWTAVDELAVAGNYNTLATVSSIAMDYLSTISGDNGYFLMIEESHIDKCSHNNNINEMMQHLLAYDLAVKQVITQSKISADTFVVITADHETGNLKWDSKEKISDKLYHSGGHTSKDVRFFIYYPNAEKMLPSGIKIDNTDISLINRKVLFNYRKK